MHWHEACSKATFFRKIRCIMVSRAQTATRDGSSYGDTSRECETV